MVKRKALIAKAKTVETTTISDARKGTTRVISPEIVCRSAQPIMFGFAHTVKTENDILATFAALANLKEDDILVVDGGGLAIAYGGELFIRDIESVGAGGIIVDGGYRDIGFVSSHNFPVYSRYAVPHTNNFKKVGDEQIDINCGGIEVRPGDFIVADENGIVVLDIEEADQILDDAIKIKEKEKRIIAGFDEGKHFEDMTNVVQYHQALKNGDESVIFEWEVS